MSDNDPNRTVPRTPSAEQPVDDTQSRVTDDSSADPNRTADHAPVETPGTITVARTPSDVARLEEGAQACADEGVPGYVLLRELGRGGMGVVYRARHVKLNRVVALKMMRGGDHPTRGEMIRFLAEAEAVAAVKHENVVQVYDYGESDGRPYMALEFCPGGTLGKLLPKDRGAAKAPREMAALLAKVARGIAAAHGLGIVHRDIKPGNVLLDEAGVPKVADFGLAKRGEGSDVTQVGQGLGTPAYMAPEQARDAKFVGPQADVWALGVILYQALTGTRPFTGTVQEIVAKAANTEPAPPRKVVASVPCDLELICLHCLAKAPHERYATAKELADDLDRYARNEPISVRPAGALERAHKWVRRNKVVAGAMAAVATALLVGTCVSLAFALYANDKAEEAEQRRKDAVDAAGREEREKLNALAAADREEKEKRRVIDAQNKLLQQSNELRRTVAKQLFGPVSADGRDKPITIYERESLWQVARLRRDDVSWVFFEEATQTPLTCKQFENRIDYVLHAGIGLDAERRDAVDQLLLAKLQHEPTSARAVTLALVASRGDASPALAAKAADVLVAALTKETDASARRNLAERLSVLAARMEPVQAAKLCTQAADVLVADLIKKEHFVGPGEDLATALSVLAARMEPARAAHAADALITALTQNPARWPREYLSAGLSALALRMEPVQAAKAAAVLVEILTQGAYGSGKPAKHLSRVAARMEPLQAAEVCARAAEALVAVMPMETNPVVRANLARDLLTLAPQMDPAQAAKVCARAANLLVANLTEETHPAVHELARSLSALAARMEPAQGADVLVAALARVENGITRGAFVQGLLALTARMEPAQAADILVAALTKETNPVVGNYLARGLAALAARMEPAQAVKACAEAADILVAALAKKTDASARRDLAKVVAHGLSALTAQMEPAQAAKVCTPVADVLVAALTEVEETVTRGELVAGLSALAARMEPARGADILVAAWAKETHPFALRDLTHGLSALAPRMDSVQAAKVADFLVRALTREKVDFTRMNLARCLSELAARMEPTRAAEVCARAADILVADLTQNKGAGASKSLVTGLVALAARMEPAQAARVRARAADILVAALTQETQAPAVRELANSLSELAGQLEPDRVMKAADILLVALTQETSSYERNHLAWGLADAIGGVADREQNRSGFATVLATGSFSAPHNLLPSLPLLHPHFHPEPRPLPPQELVELLKHPFCVGEARRAVLDALGFTYKRPFKDQWEFVEYVQRNDVRDPTTGKPLDLLSPPKRPEQKP